MRAPGHARAVRPFHPKKDPEAQAAFKKGGLADQVTAIAAQHLGKRIELGFADEARVGNKGRVCHRWWRRGERPPGVQQIGYLWAYIFTAGRPATGEDVTLLLPTVNTATMQIFLDQVAASRPADAHLVMVVDGAGWHVSRHLLVPPSITLVVLPPYRPELNPVERVSRGSGSTCASVFSHCAFSTPPMPSSMRAATPGCALSPNPTGSSHSASYPWIMKVAS